MKFTVYSILFVLPFAFVSPLCTPDQWEGVEESVTEYAGEKGASTVEEYTTVYYDYKNKRSAVETQTFEPGLTSINRIVTFGEDDSRVQYVLSYYPDDTCFKYNLTGTFEPNCIPAFAKEGTSFFLGGEGNLNVTSYFISSRDVSTKLIVSQKDDLFVPVMTSAKGRFINYGFVQTILFKNIKPGIQDETVFVVPKECEETKQNDPRIFKDKRLTRDHLNVVL